MDALKWFAVTLIPFGLTVGCGDESHSDGTEQGGAASGGVDSGSTGGAAIGGGSLATGGSPVGLGGAGSGGVPAGVGGAASGGAPIGMGGAASGGAPIGVGGAASGGAPIGVGGLGLGGSPVGSGGEATGGVATGIGGVATGGAPVGLGGAATGGVATGIGGAAGSSSGGAPTGTGGGAGATGGDGGVGGTAGSAGDAGAAGSGGSSDRPRLCILPLGDSITQSNNSHLSYRYPLWEDLNEAGYEFDFVGSMNENFGGVPSYPDQSFDRDHEGHWGWRVDEINAQISNWLGGYTPDVVLMHLGTNDAFQSQPTDGTVGELTQLIDMLRSDNERVVILLAKLIPATQSQSALDDLNGRFDALAASLSTATSPVVVVDQATGFDANSDTFDGIHPNETGEQKMATKWFDALEANWPTVGGECDL